MILSHCQLAKKTAGTWNAIWLSSQCRRSADASMSSLKSQRKRRCSNACQVLRVTLKHKPVEASYTIHGQTLELVESAKYLGVTIDSKLNFNNHIDSVAKKANGTRAFLNRNLRSCSLSIRDSTYKTYIRPMVEYASTVWDPHTRRNINKLEQVQRHSARYVTSNHDYTNSTCAMVHDLDWPTLQQRRQSPSQPLKMLYKTYNCLVDTDFTSQLTLTFTVQY